MQLWRHYFMPHSVDEALSLLSDAPGPAAPIAGGTDLLLDLEAGRHPPVTSLVDLSQVEEMRAIREEPDHLWIGAAVPLSQIVQDATLQWHAACLVEACSLIGGPQVRNVATLGGNVAHALPAGDGTIALLALDAQAQLASAGGRRWALVHDLFAEPGRPTFDRSREILVAFRLPLRPPRSASAFRRVMQPRGVAIAILNMAVWLQVTPDGALQDVRLAIGPAGPRPLRGSRTEQTLRGRAMAPATLEAALEVLREEVRLRTSPHRASAAYRLHLLPVLLERTLQAAFRGAVS